jgi:hypothetical protein
LGLETFASMAPKTVEETGESSTAATKKVLKANGAGVTNYELPWYGRSFDLYQHELMDIGLRNTDQFSLMMLLETSKLSSASRLSQRRGTCPT